MDIPKAAANLKKIKTCHKVNILEISRLTGDGLEKLKKEPPQARAGKIGVTSISGALQSSLTFFRINLCSYDCCLYGNW